jgi:hypothetical protein
MDVGIEGLVRTSKFDKIAGRLLSGTPDRHFRVLRGTPERRTSTSTRIAILDARQRGPESWLKASRGGAEQGRPAQSLQARHLRTLVSQRLAGVFSF